MQFADVGSSNYIGAYSELRETPFDVGFVAQAWQASPHLLLTSKPHCNCPIIWVIPQHWGHLPALRCKTRQLEATFPAGILNERRQQERTDISEKCSLAAQLLGQINTVPRNSSISKTLKTFRQ